MPKLVDYDWHLAEIAALEKRISDAGILKLAAENTSLQAQIKQKDEEIAALQARISDLIWTLEKDPAYGQAIPYD